LDAGKQWGGLLQRFSFKSSMKKLLFLVLAAGSISFLHAQDYKTALGVRISSRPPVVSHSLSVRHFLGQKLAVEGLLSFGGPVALGVLLEVHRPIGTKNFNLFYGGGGYVGFSSPAVAGLQGVLGLDYKVPVIPLNLSFDWKPEINLYKDFSFEPAAIGLSVRYTLN
jgi:hypothetical protein